MSVASAEREKIAARIRALRAKTVANGCTEQEAVAAAAKMAELLGRYNMTLGEAEMRASAFEHRRQRFDDLVGDRLRKIADGAAHLTGARYWVSRAGVFPVEVNFFGFQHEVAVATYLLDICNRAMRREKLLQERALALLVPVARRRQLLSFLDGMADRLRTRLQRMKPAMPTGTGLVVLHRALVDAGMAEAGHNVRTRAARSSRDFEDGYERGLAAADEVALNHGLGRTPEAAGLLR